MVVGSETHGIGCFVSTTGLRVSQRFVWRGGGQRGFGVLWEPDFWWRRGLCFLCTFGSKTGNFEGGGGRYRETDCYRMSLLYSKIFSKHCYL